MSLYHHYLRAFRRDLEVDELSKGVYAVSSNSEPGHWHRVIWNKTMLPVCDCQAKSSCSHQAAVIAYARPDIERIWNERRVAEFHQRLLAIRLGRINPRRFKRVREAMAEIESRFTSAVTEETEAIPF